jgi:LPS-assembly protein
MPPTNGPGRPRKLPPAIRPVAGPVANLVSRPPAAAPGEAAPAARSRPGLAAVLALAALALVLHPTHPGAQPGFGGLENRAATEGPVTFTAEEVEYDQTTDTVTARGRVEAWQGDRVLRADEFTYNRTTGVATATGNVALIEPDGQTLFVDRAELTDGMRDAALEGLRGLLAANARLAAAGARRTGGSVTDLARVVYSSCDLCPEDPTRPPLWQLRARIATLDGPEQRVRYRDASLEFGGVPLLYTPYFSHASPDAPRASGFLSPTVGTSEFLGVFAEIPYYWAIDESSDATISVTASSSQVPNLGGAYRRRFNSGEIAVEGSLGRLDDTQSDGTGGHIFARGRFALDENWRAGFSLNRASSLEYLRAWRYGSPRVLTTTAYLEGFWGAEGYARLDSTLYQGLDSLDVNAQTPLVLPRGYADYVFPNDGLGGRFTVDASGYSLFRTAGTDTRRLGSRATYELPLTGSMGDIWTFRTHADVVGGWVDGLALAPTFGDAGGDGFFGRGHIRSAVDWRMPFIRSAGEYGAQLIEPRVQLVTGPSTGSQSRYPNEDSLDFEFTDANLFSLNRFGGRDRFEGGTRADAALRGAWLFPNGGQIEGLAGRSVRLATDETFAEGTGLENRSSDWVGRVRLAPVPWFEVVGRARLDRETGEGRLWDGTANFYAGRFTLSGGYLMTEPQANVTTRKREEISAGASFRVGDYWRVGLFGRYDIGLDRPVAAQASLTYEDECLIFETRFVRQWAEDPATRSEYASGTLLLFRVGLKTVGDFGLRAL